MTDAIVTGEQRINDGQPMYRIASPEPNPLPQDKWASCRVQFSQDRSIYSHVLTHLHALPSRI